MPLSLGVEDDHQEAGQRPIDPAIRRPQFDATVGAHAEGRAAPPGRRGQLGSGAGQRLALHQQGRVVGRQQEPEGLAKLPSPALIGGSDLLGLARQAVGGKPRPRRRRGVQEIAAALGGVGNIHYLEATGVSQLAIVAVISSLYPAVTVVLARFGRGERWSGIQKLGLAVAAMAVVLIGV